MIDSLIESHKHTHTFTHTGKLVKLYEQTNVYDFHKTSIDNILHISRPYPLLITAGKDDNMIYLWDISHSHQRCRKIGSIKHMDKNKVFIDNLVKSMSKAQKSKYYCSKSNSSSTNSSALAAITAICDVPHTPHICVCSADCAVTVYEMYTNEACGKITSLTEVPTCIVAFPQILDSAAPNGGSRGISYLLITYSPSHAIGPSEHDVTSAKTAAWIAFGDAVGYVRILKLDPEFSPPNDTGGKSRYLKYFEQALASSTSYSQRKVHGDWIHKIMYLAEINSLATTSSDGKVCLIDFDVKDHDGVYFEGHLISGNVNTLFNH